MQIVLSLRDKGFGQIKVQVPFQYMMLGLHGLIQNSGFNNKRSCGSISAGPVHIYHDWQQGFKQVMVLK
jgi:hypothetical protein